MIKIFNEKNRIEAEKRKREIEARNIIIQAYTIDDLIADCELSGLKLTRLEIEEKANKIREKEDDFQEEFFDWIRNIIEN